MAFTRKPVSEWRKAVLAMGGPQGRPLKRAERPSTSLASRSEKMIKTYDTRRELVKAMLTETSRCEAGAVIFDYLIGLGYGCFNGRVDTRMGRFITQSLTCGGNSAPVDVHELLPRSAGGSITERSNCIAICRTCHGWIHSNPALARKVGLLKSRYLERAYEPRQRPKSRSRS